MQFKWLECILHLKTLTDVLGAWGGVCGLWLFRVGCGYVGFVAV